MSAPIRVTVWGEYRHERENPRVAAIYPLGMHGTIAACLREDGGMQVGTATLDELDRYLTARITVGAQGESAEAVAA